MSTIDELLKKNEEFSRHFPYRGLSHRPSREVVVLACMDTRLMIEPMLGLKSGEAHILRNAGGVVTEDVMRSLLVSHHLLGTQELVIINHTECGMMGFKDEDLRRRLEQETGAAAIAPATFHSFSNLDENVRQQIRRAKSHPWLPKKFPVRGFVYEVGTGRLREVDA